MEMGEAIRSQGGFCIITIIPLVAKDTNFSEFFYQGFCLISIHLYRTRKRGGASLAISWFVQSTFGFVRRQREMGNGTCRCHNGMRIEVFI